MKKLNTAEIARLPLPARCMHVMGDATMSPSEVRIALLQQGLIEEAKTSLGYVSQQLAQAKRPVVDADGNPVRDARGEPVRVSCFERVARGQYRVIRPQRNEESVAIQTVPARESATSAIVRDAQRAIIDTFGPVDLDPVIEERLQLYIMSRLPELTPRALNKVLPISRHGDEESL